MILLLKTFIYLFIFFFEVKTLIVDHSFNLYKEQCIVDVMSDISMHFVKANLTLSSY